MSLYLAAVDGHDAQTHIGELDDGDCRAAELFLTDHLSWPITIDRTSDFAISSDDSRRLVEMADERRTTFEDLGISLKRGGLGVLPSGLRSSAATGRDLLGFGD